MSLWARIEQGSKVEVLLNGTAIRGNVTSVSEHCLVLDDEWLINLNQIAALRKLNRWGRAVAAGDGKP